MNQLQLIKSEHFGEIEADIYSNDSDMFMTISQIADCLEYVDKGGVERLIERNAYLKNEEFSYIQKVPHTVGGTQSTRTFTEDGIYEVTMLSGQPKAKEFRTWIRGILKALRSGKAKLVGVTEYQQMTAQTRAENAHIRKAQSLIKIAKQYPGTTYEQVLNAYATKELTGEFLLPFPKLEAKTYSAEDVGRILGITPCKVGILANRNGLKVDQYGEWFKDKAKGCNKEVPSFRYYENVIPVLREIIDRAS